MGIKGETKVRYFRFSWFVFSLSVIAIFLSSLRAGAEATSESAEEVIEVAPVWSGHPVGFYLLTQPPHQYIAFYDADRRLTIASRVLDATRWTFSRIPETLGWDSHNSIVLAIDRTGYLHLAGNMHAESLNYYRTEKPFDAATFVQIPEMVGQEEDHVTYPSSFADREENSFSLTDPVEAVREIRSTTFTILKAGLGVAFWTNLWLMGKENETPISVVRSWDRTDTTTFAGFGETLRTAPATTISAMHEAWICVIGKRAGVNLSISRSRLKPARSSIRSPPVEGSSTVTRKSDSMRRIGRFSATISLMQKVSLRSTMHVWKREVGKSGG